MTLDFEVGELFRIYQLLKKKGFELRRYGGGPPFPPSTLTEALTRSRLILFERAPYQSPVIQVRLDIKSMIWHVHLETLEVIARGRGYVHLLQSFRILDRLGAI